MTHDDKIEIKEFTISKIEQLRLSNNAYAKKAKVSNATISALINDDWEKFSNEMWDKLAEAADWSNKEWNTALTTNNELVFFQLCMAQEESFSMSLISPAGWGKSHPMQEYCETTPNSYYIKGAYHLTVDMFVDRMLTSLGVSSKGFRKAEKIDLLIKQGKHRNEPIFAIDEFEKLPDSVWMLFITLYNEWDGHAAICLGGTPYLKTRLTNGMNRGKRGYEEIYSRIGRRFVSLYKPTLQDVRDICEANGVTDGTLIQEIFNDCEDDMRRVRRAIIIHKKKQKL